MPLALICFLLWFYFLKTRYELKSMVSDKYGGEPSGIQQESAMSRNFVIVAALTATAPLLGLLGTVLGMIRTFRVSDVFGEMSANIAGGISEALITTQLGLIIAIPGVFGLAVLKRYRRQVLKKRTTRK